MLLLDYSDELFGARPSHGTALSTIYEPECRFKNESSTDARVWYNRIG